MTIPLRLNTYLEQAGIPYSLITHIPTYTAQGTASVMHIPGKEVAKTIVLRAGEQTFLAMLPASYQANLHKLAAITGGSVRLGTEAECSALFPDCELGAIPPFGELYGMPVYVDETLLEEPQIVFSAGTHSVALWLTTSDFIHLVKPRICSFGETESQFRSRTATGGVTRSIAPNLGTRGTLFGDLFDFRRDFDSLFHRLISEPWQAAPSTAPVAARAAQAPASKVPAEAPAMDAWIDKEGKNYKLRIPLPGVDTQDIHLTLRGNALSIRAERKERSESKQVNYVVRELNYRAFERTITLPEGMDTARMTAEYENGVLEIQAPMVAATVPRRIEIGGATKAKIAAA